MKTRLSTLPNGLRIATCEMPQAETAAIGIWAAVGGRHEPKRLGGISHFIEHMLFKGTARRSARRIMEEVEGVGGDMNAFTSEERTCYYATAASDYFPRLCRVLADLYLHPRFAPRDIERERGVIAEEILMYRDEPSAHVQELLTELHWKGHPLGRPLAGTLESISRLTREDFLAYRASNYHAGSTVVSVAGKVCHEEVLERMAALLEELPRGRRPRRGPAPRKASGTLRIAVEIRETQQTQLALALPGVSYHDPRRHALHILNVILGGNASSRLFQELREKRGLCYSVSTHPVSHVDSGLFNVSLGLEQRNIATSLRLICDAFAVLKTRGVRPAELKRAKEYAIGTSRMALERSSSQNMRIGSSVLVHGQILDSEEVHQRLRAVTEEEVLQAARDFLNPAQATVAVVGPSPDAEGITRILKGC